jgi:two-component system sensor histidine kinase RegB
VTAALEPLVSLPWIVRLRWLLLGGQVVALGCARFWFGIRLPEVQLALLVLSMGILNGLLGRWLGRRPTLPSAGAVVGGMLVLDTLVLTLLLALSGGPMNPFTVLYLVHITLAAVVLGAYWTSFIAVSSVAGFGLLFVVPEGMADPHAHAALMAHHLHGMWAAFSLAALLTAYFVRRIAATIALQREHIALLREGAARNARLASLTTLAAGAAHELGTPLGTIAVAAHEIEVSAGASADTLSDARLILDEVTRCHEILAQMSSRAGNPPSSASRVSGAEIERRLLARFDAARAARIQIAAPENDVVHAPPDELLHSVYALVKNALDASEAAAPVDVRIDCARGAVEISVQDFGVGMEPQVLAHAGEPFFTTKEPGRGLGLGLFLTRAFAESQGGELALESELGRGTRAVLRLPSPASAAR